MGFPMADSAGRRTSLVISNRGRALWAQDQTVSQSGTVKAVRIGATGLEEETTLSAADARTFQGYGTTIAVAPEVVAVSAPGFTGIDGSVYLFRRGTMAPVALRGWESEIGFGRAIALQGNEIIVTAQTKSAAVLCPYLLSGASVQPQKRLENPAPDSRVAFGSALDVAGNHLLVMDSAFSTGDGIALGNSTVDLYSRQSATWSWGQRVEINAARLPPVRGAAASAAALALGRAYILSNIGVDEWSESGGRWTQSTGHLTGPEIAVDAEIVSLAGSPSWLAVLALQRTQGSASPHLFAAVRHFNFIEH
jgi:hypothetical protein